MKPDLEQIEIYYLFMLADGYCDKTELKILDDILAKADLDQPSMDEFLSLCGKMQLQYQNHHCNADIVIQEIDELLENGVHRKSAYSMFGYPFGRSSVIERDKKIQAQVIWTLINLGYADKEYSDSEKKVVAHLVQRWDMDPALIAELNDTADALLALTMQKEWVENSAKPYREVHEIVEEVERNIASLSAAVEVAISEVEIA